jgi:hypothetical protein
MKMVKSLILGTAVAFAATAGAQAADLPVKAKPVSYVKICPQYGPGFYYIPGTDICLRVGGLVFAEAGYYAAGAITQLSNGANGFDGADNRLAWRSRGYLAIDARQNTPYGTLRAYIFGGLQQISAPVAAVPGVNNSGFLQFAFIQFAGFTAGTATSFFDFAPNYLTLSVSANPWNWTNLFAYTANFGNGLSATISIEDATTTRLTIPVGALPQAAQEAPDVVGNIRLDQAWGSAQIMAAAHHVRPDVSGLALDDWGWAVGIGIEIKLPMIGAATSIKFSAVTSEGAPEYTGISGNPYGAAAGIGLGFGSAAAGQFVTVTDGAVNAGVITLTDASSFMLQLRHSWTPQLRSAFHAGYNEAYNLTAAGFGGVQVVQYGHSLQYSPVPNLTLALDVLFTEVDTNNSETDKVATWFRVTRPF